MSEIKFASYTDFTKNKKMMTRMPKPPEVIRQANQDGQWHDWMADLRSKDLSNFDLSAYDPMDFDWDTSTTWPSAAQMPPGFDHQRVLEEMKDPGLGLRYLHFLGLTGKGLSMAIIDARLPDHQEYHDRIVHYEEFGDFSREKAGSMHGAAVTSIAVGKTVGVAPEADVYYFAEQNKLPKENPDADEKLTFENVVQSVRRILEINKTLPKGQRIQIISMSWNTTADWPYRAEMRQVVEECKKAGIFFNTTSCYKDYGLISHGLSRDINKDPNEPQSYGETTWGKENYIHDTLSFPMDHRTTAAPQGYDQYVHYSQGGWSWKQPFESALFLLARQINPSITPEHFWEIGLKTATKQNRINIVNPIQLVNTLSKEMLSILTQKKKLTAQEKRHIIDLKKWIKGTDVALKQRNVSKNAIIHTATNLIRRRQNENT